MNDQVKFSDIVFLDIEASGLGDQCFPVEIGFVFAASLVGWSALIQPIPTWLGRKSWEQKAESLHGLPLDRLLKEGADVVDVTVALNHTLADKQVFSDAPDFDGHWLSMLFAAARKEPAFELHDSAELFCSAVTVQIDASIAPPQAEISLRRHRARDDACALAIRLLGLLG